MIRFSLLLFVALHSAADRSAAQEKVQARDITSVIKLDEIIFGHLTELNDKFKLRAKQSITGTIVSASSLCVAARPEAHSTTNYGLLDVHCNR